MSSRQICPKKLAAHKVKSSRLRALARTEQLDHLAYLDTLTSVFKAPHR